MSKSTQYAPWHESDDEDDLPLMSDQEISSFAKNAKKLMEQGRFKVAGDVVPIKRPPLEPAPKPQSPATSEGMKSIDKMMDALRGPIKRP